MKQISLPSQVLFEIASSILIKSINNVFLSKKELAVSLNTTTKTVERARIRFTYKNGKNIYNIKDVLDIIENNYTGKNVSNSSDASNIKGLLRDYTQELIKIIMIDNPNININLPERWIFQDYLIKIGISSRKLYYLRKTKRLAFSFLPSSRFYYKISDIIDCIKDIKNNDIEYLVKNSLFYQYIGDNS